MNLDKILPGIARSIGWEAILAAISFPASVLLNRALGAEQRGLLALAVLIPTTLFTLGNCQWDRIARGLVTSRTISPNEAWRRTVVYCLRLTLVFVPLGIVASFLYAGLPAEARLWSAVYCLNYPIYFLGGSIQAVFLASGGLDAQYQSRLSMQLSYLGLLFVILTFGWASVASIIAIYVVIHVVSLLAALVLKDRVLSGEVQSETPSTRPLLRALPPLVAESLAARADVWAFSLVGTLSSVGQYSGLSALMLPIALVSNAMLSSSTARLNWTNPSEVRRYLKTAALTLALMCVVVAVGSIYLGPLVLNWLLGKTYASGEWMIPWIAAIVVGQAMANQFHTSVQLSGHSAAFLRIQSGDAVLRIALVLGSAMLFKEPGLMAGVVLSSIIKTAWSGYVLLNEQQVTRT